MNISLKTILSNIKRGYKTLQICCSTDGDGSNENYPDEYFCIKDAKFDCPNIGQKIGYLYLTSSGYNFFKEDIKKAYLSKNKNNNWQDFEDYAVSYFTAMDKGRIRLIKKYQNYINELQNFKV